MENRLGREGFTPVSEKNHITFPLNRMLKLKERVRLLVKIQKFSIVKEKFPKLPAKKISLKSLLEGKLTKAEMKHLITSFNVVGSIAIIEIPAALKKKEKIIGSALLQVNKNIKTACKITSAHKGEFRLQPVKVIAGERSTETIHREAGCKFKVKIGKVFFSPRLSTERLRISKIIKKDETVAALFAGVGPFPIVFAKNSKMKKAYAVELNPAAAVLMNENVALNKVRNKVEVFKGDVRKIVPKLKGKCDRVVMPLPRGGETFLKHAFMCLKPKGGVIHFYQIVDRNSPYRIPLERVRGAAKAAGRMVKIIRKAQVRTFSSSKIQVVIDIRVY